MQFELDHSWVTDRTERPANQSKIFDMINPLWCCSGPNELDKFLETLRTNFPSHKHLFPRADSTQVKYSVSFLGTWKNHPDPTQGQTKNSDPSEWGSDVRDTQDLCLENFELFTRELQKMYGDIDWRLNSAIKTMQAYWQLPNKSVRRYANSFKANRRRADWNLIMHEVFLYNMAWAGRWQVLKTKVGPWISSGKHTVDKQDQLFHCGAASEFKPDDNKPYREQQPWQAG